MLILTWLACTDPIVEDHPIPATLRTVHVDRTARRLYLLDDGVVAREEPIGIGRGGLGAKETMQDLITPTGTFTVDLILSESGVNNAVAAAVPPRFAGDAEFASLLGGEPGLAGLYRNMSIIDFDADGDPDKAYGTAYIGLDGAVTGPKMRRFKGTAYWFSIALHGTPNPENLGEANSGGCVHVAADLLGELIEDQILTIGSTVTIADTGPTHR